jgi:kumamolisin
LTVTAAAKGNFTLTANPTSITVARGSSGTSVITSKVTGGFNNAVTLSTMGTGKTFSPNPIPAPGSGTSTMTVTVGAHAALGTTTITINGTGGGISRKTTVSLTVTQ